MTRKQSISWTDILDLRVVKCLGQLLQRRWGLGLGFLAAGGQEVDDEGDPLAPGRALCELLRCPGPSRPICCAEAGSEVIRLLREAEEPSSLTYACPAGLSEVAAHVLIDGEVQGVVRTSGFLRAGEGDREAVRRALEDLVPFTPQLEQALEEVPRLDQAEELVLREIVQVVAEEIVRFQGEVASTERRQPLTPVDRGTRYSYDKIIGEGRAMQELFHLLDKVIDSDSTVLVQGENGTGKELIAKAIHFNSSRRDRRFVVQNCSAFNDNLLDSELFGHKKGSFTGAISDKQGLFEVADGSTFFLDEIGDMSPSLQVKLLRVLQEGTFIPVGDTQPKKVDVRIIAATNRDLKRMVERGEFREDLYYRINVINIHVPPLRERKEDILQLVDHFLQKQARGNHHRLKKLSRACLACLMEYNWPGNIRELENEIERLVVLTSDEKLIAEDLLSSRIRQQTHLPEAGSARGPNCLPEAVEDLERTMIYEVLKRNHWNKTRAAQELHISRRNLIRKVNKYQLDQRQAR